MFIYTSSYKCHNQRNTNKQIQQKYYNHLKSIYFSAIITKSFGKIINLEDEVIGKSVPLTSFTDLVSKYK